MRKLPVVLILIFTSLVFQGFCQHKGALSSLAFTSPDTVCQGNEVSVINTSPGTTFYWNFCTGNTTYLPEGINIGDPGGHLRKPHYIHTVKDSTLFFSFISSSQEGELIRFFHGDALTGYVDSVTNLGKFGVLTSSIRGICTGNDEGHWYLFVVNGSTVLRLDFGNSLMNDPVAEPFFFSELIFPEKIMVLKEGDEWVGFITDYQKSKLIRLRFGNSLSNTPLVESSLFFLPLSGPCGFDIKKEDGDWYMIVCNRNNSSIGRIYFGNSLLNTPTGEYLTGLNYLEMNSDVTLSQDCERTNGYVTNWLVSGYFILHLQFDYGLAGPVTLSPMGGNPAILNQPYGVSEIFREGDLLYMLVVNNGSSMISRLEFRVCGESSIATWDGHDPPPVTYSIPGNYNIILRVDEGTPDEQVFCRNIVVLPRPEFTLGPDRIICANDTAWLNPGQDFLSYLWSTGDTSQILPVCQPGIYWLEVINPGDCTGRDTVFVSVNQTFLDVLDTSICYGSSYWAQNAWQTETGTYFDTLITVHDCDSILQTNLATEICDLRLWFPNSFTPNDDGLNDMFRPVGLNVSSFRMIIFDRWGLQLFETSSLNQGWDGTFKGKSCIPEIYFYVAYYKTYENSEATEKRIGNFILIR